MKYDARGKPWFKARKKRTPGWPRTSVNPLERTETTGIGLPRSGLELSVTVNAEGLYRFLGIRGREGDDNDHRVHLGVTPENPPVSPVEAGNQYPTEGGR